MAPPKAINPKLAAILHALIENPATVVCPACGATGFWDNRESKKRPESPDFRCRNAECKGAKPVQDPRPYALWIPEEWERTPPPPSSKRVPSPPVLLPNETGEEDYLDAVADPAPPAEDYPVREPVAVLVKEPGEEPKASEADPTGKIARARARRDSYLRLWDAVAAHHLQWVNKGIVLTDDGINATAATIWIDLQKANLL